VTVVGGAADPLVGHEWNAIETGLRGT
jgi:hypothetical protein